LVTKQKQTKLNATTYIVVVGGAETGGGLLGSHIKYWQNVLIKQKTDKYWHLTGPTNWCEV